MTLEYRGSVGFHPRARWMVSGSRRRSCRAALGVVTLVGGALFGGAAVGGAASSALAQEDGPAPLRAGAVSLVVVRDATASECPDEVELRHQVEARMGAEVFAPDGPARVLVRLSQRRGVHHGTVSILDGDRLVGERTVEDRDCGEVVEATAVLLALLIVPPARAEAPAPSGGGPDAASTAPPIEPAPPSETPPVESAHVVEEGRRDGADASEPFRFVALAGAGVLLGWLPDASFLLRAGIGVGQRSWSVRVEARAALDDELSAQVGPAEVTAVISWAGGAVSGCGHLDVLALCGHVVLARSAARGVMVEAARSDEALVLGLGASAGVGWSPWPWLRLEAEAELDVPVLVPEARVGGAPVWRATPVAGMGSLGASISIE